MDVDFNSHLLLELGAQIAYFRKLKGLTQAQLAEQLAVEPETVSRFERGSTAPSLQRLFALADVLGVGVQQLLSQASPLVGDKLSRLETQLALVNRADQDLVIEVALKLAKRLSRT